MYAWPTATARSWFTFAGFNPVPGEGVPTRSNSYADGESSPGPPTACLVLVMSVATHGARPHSKPPFWTTLSEGLGTQVAAGVAVVGGAEEEVGGADVEEEEEGGKDADDSGEMADEGADDEGEGRKDAEDTTEVAGETGLGVEVDAIGGPLLYLGVEPTHQRHLHMVTPRQ